MPLLREKKRNISVMIAGAKPARAFEERLLAEPNIFLVADPPDAAVARAQARVLMNPILRGSGLNTKTVEMLYDDAALVVTPFAIAGLDDAVKEVFEVSDTPESFAASILRCLSSPFEASEARMRLRESFGSGGLASTASHFRSEIDRNGI
jgi:hypothetical protein